SARSRGSLIHSPPSVPHARAAGSTSRPPMYSTSRQRWPDGHHSRHLPCLRPSTYGPTPMSAPSVVYIIQPPVSWSPVINHLARGVPLKLPLFQYPVRDPDLS